MSGNYHALTTREMVAKGYKLAPNRHPGSPSTCKRCGDEIEWWITPNNHKSVPYDPADRDDTERTCHFTTCSQNSGNPPAAPAPRSNVPSIAEMSDIQRIIVAEYKRECEGDAGYLDPEHKKTWLLRKLAEARYILAVSKGRR